MGSRIGERPDDLQLLNDRSGPPVRDYDRQSPLMLRTNVDEMNVQPVDLGDELRQRVQFRLALAPIVFGPMAREFLSRRKLHALRCIRDRFPLRPLCCVYAPAQISKFRFGKIHTKWSNSILVSRLLAALLCSHGLLLLSFTSCRGRRREETSSGNVMMLAALSLRPSRRLICAHGV